MTTEDKETLINFIVAVTEGMGDYPVWFNLTDLAISARAVCGGHEYTYNLSIAEFVRHVVTENLTVADVAKMCVDRMKDHLGIQG